MIITQSINIRISQKLAIRILIQIHQNWDEHA